MKFLICDDDDLMLKKLSLLIKNSPENKCYSNKIIEITNPTDVNIADEYDVAFLDIDMPQMSGIDLARKIHEQWPNTVIIFITNYVQYAPDGYEVGAFRYLMKNQITEKLIDYLDLAIKERTKRLRVITIQINGERINVPVSNILYMESSARIITMHLIENVRPMYQFYGNMSDLAQKFEILGFLRVHKSYLVNMKYIEIFQCKRLEIKGGILIPSSERKYSELKQRYLTWEAENKWSIF
ncbi:MAG: response regulator transcription factor [Faecalibacterium prausnitzii]|nr:response regulator transcription factor [Faecalibacterium prausnitzii]